MKYRCYYNGPEPPMWSIDEGTKGSEICVQNIEYNSAGNLTFRTDPSDGDVRAWVEIDGILEVVHGIAKFHK